MSRIDALIKEICPDGTLFRPIGDLLKPVARINWPDNYTKEVLYIDLTSVPPKSRFRVDDRRITSLNAPSRAQQLVNRDDVLFATTRPLLRRYLQVPASHDLAVASTGYCVLRANKDLLHPSFLYHLVTSERFLRHVEAFQEGASYPSISDRHVKAFRVPVPPMSVQEEIVRILDTFTELEAELEAELALRAKQLQEMRDRVYSIAGVGPGGQQSLSEVGSFTRGTGLMKSDLRKTGAPAIHYGQIHTNLDVWAEGTDLFVDEPLFGKLRKAEPGDAIVVTTSEDDEAVGKTIVWMGKRPVAVSGETYIFRHELDPFYLAHFFYSSSFHKQKSRYLTGTKVRRISGKDLEKILIPVRPLPEQRKIGLALNSLHALLRDIGHGIPAEIAARRKQYEYYRDKLLTFEEKVA